MNKKLPIFLLLITAVWLTPAAARMNLSLNGYYKSFFIAFELPDYLQSQGIQEASDTPPLGAVNNRVRLKMSARFSKWLSLHAAYDVSPTVQDPRLFRQDILMVFPEPASYRFDDFFERLYPRSGKDVGSFAIFHNLDRFYFTLKTGFADIFIGRQAIAWGSARVINPTDVIAPFAFNELDTEERRGVDALRVRLPLGMMDELDFGFVAGQDFAWKKSAFFARGKVYILKTDLSLLLLGFRQHLLLGFDMTRAIGGAGFWLETAYVVPEFFKKEDEKLDRDNYFRASIGLDYNFGGKTYGFAEYHFNAAGRQKPEDYLENFNSPAYQDGAVYLMGKHYLNVGITYQIHPLIPFTGLIIWNLSDGSLVLSPTAEYNIAENIYLMLGAYIGLGKKPEQVLSAFALPETRLQSEFGAYPGMFFTAFRIYF